MCITSTVLTLLQFPYDKHIHHCIQYMLNVYNNVFWIEKGMCDSIALSSRRNKEQLWHSCSVLGLQVNRSNDRSFTWVRIYNKTHLIWCPRPVLRYSTEDIKHNSIHSFIHSFIHSLTDSFQADITHKSQRAMSLNL